MAQRRVIAYFMHEEEEAAAQFLLSNNTATQSSLVGIIDDAALTARGLWMARIMAGNLLAEGQDFSLVITGQRVPDFAVNEDGGQHRSAACPLAVGCAGQDAGRAGSCRSAQSQSASSAITPRLPKGTTNAISIGAAQARSQQPACRPPKHASQVFALRPAKDGRAWHRFSCCPIGATAHTTA